MKSAAFVFRTEGCAEPAKAQIGGTAEGLVKGARRSVVLKLASGTKPGVYAVYENWPAEGDWVVNLKGVCANASAGAVVPIGPKGFIRESSKFFPRPATDAEVETALKELSQKREQMKSSTLTLVLVVSAAVLLIAADTGKVQSDGLTIHEWGTFTSVAGEDGSAIDWDALGCKTDLPGFVNAAGYRGFKFRLQGDGAYGDAGDLFL